jgi:cbb3-type cytochrome c oxidase subunit II
MDRLTSILIGAGLLCFALSFVLSGLYPWLVTDAREPEATVEELAREVSLDFKQLRDVYPAAFDAAFPGGEGRLTDREAAALPADDPRREASAEAWRAAYAVALRQGRDRYVGEACWHCHSQYVRSNAGRPVANEDVRFGRISEARDDNHALQRPVLWGTRRVGPDLTREGGLRTNDWHLAHLWNPPDTSPGSIMPRYTWFFDDGFEVRRRIEPETAEREGLPAETSYRVASGFRTRAEAEAAMARIADALPPSRAEERPRLFVPQEAVPVPNAAGLSMVAYLQWLGTWRPAPRGDGP